MELVNEQGTLTDLFKRLISSGGEQRKRELTTALKNGYPFLFSKEFNLATATGNQLWESFNDVPLPDADAVRESVAFFLAAAMDVGIELPAHFHQRHRRSRLHDHRSQTGNAGNRMAKIPAERNKILWGLIEQLPEPGSLWPQIKREQWIQAVLHILPFVYRDKE
jgi:hypothetical protein